jgi:MFS superfamily sulfate permease-like transporter
MAEIEPTATSASVPKNDLLASIVVFLVALPLCMGVAIASGVPVIAGLLTGVIGGCVVGLIAGCPLQVSGPAAGLTVIIFEMVNHLGLENLGVVVFLAGLLQVVAGAFRLGQWFRAVSPAVIRGLLAGIGFLILAGQFHVMLDGKPPGAGAVNLAMIPEALSSVADGAAWPGREQWAKRSELLPRVRQSLDEQTLITAAVSGPRADSHSSHTQPEGTSAGKTPAASDVTSASSSPPARDKKLAVNQQHLAEAWEVVWQDAKGWPWESQFKTAFEAARDAAAGLSADAAADQQTTATDLKRLLTDAKGSASAAADAVRSRGWAAMLGIATLMIIWGWTEYAPARLRLFPGALVAVLLVSTAAVWFGLPVARVQLPDNVWSTITLASFSGLSGPLAGQIFAQAALVAVVASAETLLCASAVDQLHTGPRTRYDRELSAQGLGNLLCGLVGALPMTGVIVRSSANVQAGGKTRWSTVLHGLWLAVFVIGLAGLLRLIPTSCLAAILVYTGFRLIDVRSISELRRFGLSEVVIYAVTVSMIVFEDLLVGVLCGVGLSAAKLLYTFSHIQIVRERNELAQDEITLRLRGSATFLRLPQIAVALEKIPPGTKVHVDLSELDYIDHACLELLSGWSDQHRVTGGDFTIDWETLHRRFRRDHLVAGSAKVGADGQNEMP